MEHLTLKAVTTITDKGEFTAIAAAYSVDRMNHRIIPGAFKSTIEAWRGSGKTLPLHWDHESDPASIIGFVEPSSMEEQDGGLFVKGQLDLETSEMAREAWRSMKNNAIALSFGFLFKSRKGKNGVKELTEIDLFEITLTPAPVNADSRILSMKSATAETETVTEEPETEPAETPEEPVEETPSAEELRKHTFDLALELAGGATKAHEGDDAGLAALEEALKDRRVQLAIWQALKSIAETGETPPPDDGEPETPETSETSAVEDGKDEEPGKAKSTPQDPLRKRTFDLALGISNGGMRVPTHLPVPEPEPEPLNEAELRRQSLQAALAIARGD